MAYIFTIANITQSLVLFILWCAKNDKLKDSIHKSMSGAPQWLPECIRGSKPVPNDRCTGPQAQAAHLFAIAANGGVMAAPPSPMIRASGHHHNGPLQGSQSGSLSQLTVGTPINASSHTYQSPPPGIAHHQTCYAMLTCFVRSTNALMD